MSIQKVSYEDKVDLQIWASIPNTNKIKAEDMNGIKKAINGNADELSKSQKDIASQNKQLQILTNALPSETQEGESINIKGTVPVKFKEFKVSGNSKQETRSGKNLLDLTKSEALRGGTIEFKESSIVAKPDGTIAMQIKVPCPLEQGDYFVHLEDVSDVNLAFRGVSGENVSSNVYVSKAITLSENLDYLVINIATLTDEVEIAYDKLYINEGNTDLDYEPYGAMPSPEFPSPIQNVEGDVNVSVCNKNILNNVIENQTAAGVTVIKNEDGSITLNGTATSNAWVIVTENIMVSKGNNVLSLKNKIAGLGLYLGSSSNTDYAVTQSTTTEEKTFDLQENTVFDVVRLRIMEGTVFNNLTVYPMLEKNTIGTDYVPHEQQTVTFPLSEGQKLMLGDYLADDGIHHVRKQMELDGTEDWKYYTGSAAPFTLTISGAKSPDTHNDILKSLCNQYKAVAWVGISQIEDNYLLSTPTQGLNYTIFRIKNTDYADIDSFKSYLVQQKQAGTPVILEYELAEEETEAYTEEQQEAYDQLKKLKSYADITHIYSTNSTSPIFNVTAIKNANAMYENLNSKIENIIELLSTTATSAMLLENMQSDLESEVM